MANLRTRTATFIATMVALILVLAFGNPGYQDWVRDNARGHGTIDLFLQALAWPQWSFDSGDTARTLFVIDLKAVLVVVLTWVFVLLVGRGPWSGVRGAFGHFLHGWAAYIFAGSFAAFLAALFAVHASLAGAIETAAGGATYGLLVGWIVGLTTLASDA